jgi:redox-sensitive bicupin YhaK (pirin superfamily)
LLQIWIEPEKQNLPPSYEQRQIAIGDDWTPLIAPDQTGVMAIARPVRLWRAQPKNGTTLQLPASSHPRTWLQMIDGSATLGSAERLDTDLSSTTANTSINLSSGDGIGLGPNHSMTNLQSRSDDCDLLLFALA